MQYKISFLMTAFCCQHRFYTVIKLTAKKHTHKYTVHIQLNIDIYDFIYDFYIYYITLFPDTFQTHMPIFVLHME